MAKPDITRRDALTTMGLAVGWSLALGTEGLAQQRVDPDFLRMWEAAQAGRPARLASSGRIAPEDEPGTPLIVRGRLFDKTGATPVRGATIFAYQTDRTGVYHPPGATLWRLKGRARTDERGAFELRTIRPGAYPGRQIAAHIHVGVDGPPGQRQTLLDVLFEGDPRLSARERERSAREGRFANIRPVETTNGVESLSILFRLSGDFVF